MPKQIEAYKYSDTFKELYNKKSINTEEYLFCLNEWQASHNSLMIRYYIYTALLFCGGLWAVYEQIWVIAVLLLALAANYNRQSSHHILFSEIINLQKLAAKHHNELYTEPTEQDIDEGVISEVNEFAESHPYFDELSDEIAKFIKEGMTLEDAYNKALANKQKNT